MNNKPMRVKLTTPRGSFRWPRLDAPDYGNEKYPKPDGEFSVQLVLQADAPETKAFIAKLTPYHEQAVRNGEQKFKDLKVDQRKKLGSITVNDLFTTVYDEETEEPTGELVFKFTMKAGGTTKKGKRWAQKPVVVDAKGNTIAKVPRISSGTIGRVSFDFDPEGYFIPGTGAVGLSRSLLGVQIIDLVVSGQRSAKDLGFEEEEGFEYDPDQFADAEETSTSEGENAHDEEDF